MSGPRLPSTPSLTRRRMLQTGTAGLLIGMMRASAVRAAPPTTRPIVNHSWKARPDLQDSLAASNLEIIQITTDPHVPSSHVYMEAQIFTPDSKRFVLHRSTTAHGDHDQRDPKHQYLLCDIADNFSLHPLTDEIGPTAPSVSPDGKCLYYFIDETKVGGGSLTLKRVNLDGTDRRTIMVLDHALPDTTFRPSMIYPLSTISSDGKRIAISAFLGDHITRDQPHGLIVFDVERAAAELVLHGPTWCNVHPQFCRSTDPQRNHDVLVQENHGYVFSLQGNRKVISREGPDLEGADIHVIRDDGTNLRDLPWGRDGDERCQGHQCWRGRSEWAITSTSHKHPPEVDELVESRPVPHVGHLGRKTPGGKRNVLSRDFEKPCFYHFGTDIDGSRLITDSGCPYGPASRIYVARLGTPGLDPLRDFVCVAYPKNSGTKDAHLHPFLSPDGRIGFFNSDESGLLQAYLVRGFA